MNIASMFARRVVLAVLSLTLVGLVGCNSGSGGTADLPTSDGKAPPPPPASVLGADGKPKSSTAAYDTARGARPPK